MIQKEGSGRMRLAIVEDEAVHGKLLEQYIADWAVQNDVSASIKTYVSAESFLFAWEDMPCDAVFADIQMPGMDGMEMVRRVKGKIATAGKKIRYLSGKGGHSHGFGLMRVDRAVERCKGYIDRQDEENVFVTEIMLPLVHE